MVIVDSSPKFLRIALDRFRSDERVAFRRLRYLKEERRLQYVDEVLPPGFTADALVSTNAIHLYDDLESTLRAWTRVLRPGATARINSGNIRNPRARENEWIIDDTVFLVQEAASRIVRADERYAPYRAVLDDEERLRAYLDYRDRVFLAPRPLEYYLDVLRAAGFDIAEVTERTIEAEVDELVRVPRGVRRRRARLGRRSGQGGRRRRLERGCRRSPAAPPGLARRRLRRQPDVRLLLDLHLG